LSIPEGELEDFAVKIAVSKLDVPDIAARIASWTPAS